MLFPKLMIAPLVTLEQTLLATQDSKVVTKNIAESEEKKDKATVLICFEFSNNIYLSGFSSCTMI